MVYRFDIHLQGAVETVFLDIGMHSNKIMLNDNDLAQDLERRCE